jgi:hypothetical protein
MAFFSWVLARVQESSTWYGLAAILTTAGLNLDPALSKEIVSFGVSAAGFIAVITKNKT